MAAVRYRLRSWARGRWRVVGALTLIIAVAGGVALVLLAGAIRTLTAPDRYSSWRGDTYDIAIEQSHGRPRTAELAALPAVDRVDAASFVFGGVTTGGVEDALNALVFAGDQGPLGSFLVEGREPDRDHPGEFIASRSLVESSGVSIGDELTLLTFTQKQADESGFDAGPPEGPTMTATLVGIVDGPSELEGDYAIALFSSALLDEGDVGVSASPMVAALTPGSTIDDVRAQLDDLAEGDAFSIESAELVGADIRAAVNAQGQGLLVVAVIVAAATVVVLGQLLSRQLRLADDERATLASLGLNRPQIVGEPLCRVAIVGFGGALLAVAIAYACSGLFPFDFVERVEPHPGRRFDLLVLGLGPPLLVLALVGWVLLVLLIDARRSTTIRGVSAAEKIAAVVPSAQLSTALRLAFARVEALVRPARTPLVGLTLVFCVLFAALTFGINFNRLVDEPERYGVNFDLAIGAGATEISADIERALDTSPDVGALTLYGTIQPSVGAESLYVVGMRPVRGDLAPEVLEGRLPQSDDEIALGRVSARDLDVHVGDTFAVERPSGPRTLRVSGLVLVPPVGGADGVGDGGVVTEDGFLAIDRDATMNTATVRIASGAAPGAADRIAERTESAAGQIDIPPEIVNLRRVRSMPYWVASAVGALALLSLGHLMIVSVRRRRLDHAILRAMGATPRWLGGVVHWQATIMTFVVVVVAVPLGIALGQVVYRPFVANVGARSDVLVPLLWLGAGLVGCLALANVAAAVPARKTRRDSPTRLLTQA